MQLIFDEALGFPGFYGRNMDASIDCMTYLDDLDAAMTSIHAKPGSIVTIGLVEVGPFAERCPDQYAAIVECAAFVNWRRIERGAEPVLALSFNK